MCHRYTSKEKKYKWFFKSVLKNRSEENKGYIYSSQNQPFTATNLSLIIISLNSLRWNETNWFRLVLKLQPKYLKVVQHGQRKSTCVLSLSTYTLLQSVSLPLDWQAAFLLLRMSSVSMRWRPSTLVLVTLPTPQPSPQRWQKSEISLCWGAAQDTDGTGRHSFPAQAS